MPWISWFFYGSSIIDRQANLIGCDWVSYLACFIFVSSAFPSFLWESLLRFIDRWNSVVHSSETSHGNVIKIFLFEISSLFEGAWVVGFAIVIALVLGLKTQFIEVFTAAAPGNSYSGWCPCHVFSPGYTTSILIRHLAGEDLRL